MFFKRTGAFPRISTLIVFIALLCAVSFNSLSRTVNHSSQWRWSGVARVVVVPDVHGAFNELTGLLLASGIINEALAWIGEDSHLVSLGDLLDRGSESRKVMDLLMRLQREARAQGGNVHVVAGNHEIMNLMGDLRYVSAGEFAAFSADEPATERERGYQLFSARRSEDIALSFLRSGAGTTARTEKAFAELYPPGYFGRQQAISSAGHYGRWLLSLPAMIVINQTVFVHGGLPAVTASADLETINRRYHADMRRFLGLWRELIDAGVLLEHDVEDIRSRAIQALRIADPASCARTERADCLRERGSAKDEQRALSPATLAALKEFVALQDSAIIGPDGPLWYRGSVRCKDILEVPILEAALANLNAKRVIVGHTPTTDRRVHRIRDGRVIMLDTGMLVSHYRGRPAALLIEDTELTVQYLNPTERTKPLGNGGNGVYRLTASQLQQALESGTIVDVNKGWGRRRWQVELAYEGETIEATFYTNEQRQAANLELAAFELDRLLDFGIVPLTVARQIDGEHGALQLSYPDTVTEARRRRQGIEIGGWCPLQPQYDLLHVFDLLVDNANRSETTIVYDTQTWALHATRHAKTFSTSRKLADSLSEQTVQLSPAVLDSLTLIDKPKLSSALGQWLDKQQIAAIIARRDALLGGR